MISVRIQNYQSIEDLEVKIEGFTVLTGKNNTGKSAIMRAVNGLFTNQDGNHFVRHGADHCTVEIRFSDGNFVIWKKGKGVNQYEVNGATFDKVGRGVVPDEVQNLGVRFLSIAGEKIWPQFAPQWKGQIFLLDRPGSFLAEAIADVESVGWLNRALKSVESDSREAKTRIKVKEEEREACLVSLKNLEGVEDLVQSTQEMLEAEKNIGVLEERAGFLLSLSSKKDVLVGYVEKLEAYADLQIPSEKNYLQASKMLQEVSHLIRLKESAEGTYTRYKDLADFEIDWVHGVEEGEKQIMFVGGLQKKKEQCEVVIEDLCKREVMAIAEIEQVGILMRETSRVCSECGQEVPHD